MKKKIKSNSAIIYARVSNKNEKGLREQEKQCRQFCEEQGLEVAKVFSVTASSLATENTQSLLLALRYCKENAITEFIVTSYDRISRDLELFETVRAGLDDNGTILSSTGELIIRKSSAEKLLMANLMESLAAFTSGVPSLKMKRGIAAKRAKTQKK